MSTPEEAGATPGMVLRERKGEDDHGRFGPAAVQRHRTETYAFVTFMYLFLQLNIVYCVDMY